MNTMNKTLLMRTTYNEVVISLYRDNPFYVVRVVAPRGTADCSFDVLARARDHFMNLQSKLSYWES